MNPAPYPARDSIRRRAQNELDIFVIELIKKHDLSFVEILRLLHDTLDIYLGYLHKRLEKRR